MSKELDLVWFIMYHCNHNVRNKESKYVKD
jgi:hypothetical protein